MYQLYEFKDWQHLLNSEKDLVQSVKSMDFRNDIPGGWLKYCPPRKVTGYGDGSLISDYGKIRENPDIAKGKWSKTAWSASVPYSGCTVVNKTRKIPKKFKESGIFHAVRTLLPSQTKKGIENDLIGTGIWCNYYVTPNNLISAHTDDEDYYYGHPHPLFVSLTLYDDEDLESEETARFQIQDSNKKWIDIKLKHLSLLIMSGSVKHRVLKYKEKDISKFRTRYNITFRTPVPAKVDIIKNFRFFSNFSRYYVQPSILIVPPELNETGKEVISVFQKTNDKLKILILTDLKRDFLLDEIKEKGYSFKNKPKNTTTNDALLVLLESL